MITRIIGAIICTTFLSNLGVANYLIVGTTCLAAYVSLWMYFHFAWGIDNILPHRQPFFNKRVVPALGIMFIVPALILNINSILVLTLIFTMGYFDPYTDVRI